MPRKSDNAKSAAKSKKQRNGLLEAAQFPIVYIKDLKLLEGIKSTHACLVMSQIEYWVSKMGDGFYKFLEPPETNQYRYKVGDSWTEELGISYAEFVSAFDQIGVRYKSKKEYDEAKAGDEFGEKYYCSYFNKITRQTFYFRNKPKVEKAISFLRNVKTKSPVSEDSEVSVKGKSSSRDEEESIIENNFIDLESSDTTSDNTTKITSEREEADSHSEQIFNGERKEASIDSSVGCNESKTIPTDFTPSWDAKYRAVMHFPDKSPAWVTEKFIANFRAKPLRLTDEQWHLKWWDWMQSERDSFGNTKLDDEHDIILNHVAVEVFECANSLPTYLFDISELQDELGGKYSEETLTNVTERMYEGNSLGKVGNYYFNNLGRDKYWSDIAREIVELELIDETIYIRNLKKEPLSLREIHEWERKRKAANQQSESSSENS